MSTLNVAVVGLGAIGREHCDIYASLRGANLAAVVDPALSADVVAQHWPQARLLGSLADVLADDTIDAVSLHARRCALRGRHRHHAGGQAPAAGKADRGRTVRG